MGAGILMLSPAIIAIFFGDKYAESASVLAILSLGLGLTYARLVFSWLLTAVNLAKYALLEYIYCLIINLSLNVLLIPHFASKVQLLQRSPVRYSETFTSIIR